MKLQKILSLKLLVLASLVAVACAPKAEKRPATDRRSPIAKDANPNEDVIQLTATFEKKPADVFVYLNAQSSNEQVRNRIRSAAVGFAARYRFVADDIRLVFVKGRFEPGVPGGMTYTVDGTIDPKTPELQTAIEAKFEMEADVGEAVTSLDPYLAMLNHLRSPESLALLRPGAMLAVLNLGSMDHPIAPNLGATVGQLSSGLDTLKGAGNWSASFVNNLAKSESGEDCGQLIDEPSVAAIRTLSIASKGLAKSICDESISSIMASFLVDATGRRYFDLIIEPNLDPQRMRIESDNRYVAAWKYEPTSGKLTLPQSIGQNAPLFVYTNIDNLGPSQDNPFFIPGEIKQEKKQEKTPEEQLFLDNLNPILEKNCNGGGCHGRNSNRTQYVGNYTLVRKSKVEILKNIQLPEGEEGRMPPNGMDADELQSLVDLMNALP